MTRGLVVGKFYPPHLGHHALIDFAAARCDQLVVLVAGATVESIPLDLRHRWLVERHPGVVVRSIVDDHPIDYDDGAVWDAHMAVFRTAVPERVDTIFASEAYGPELARRFGARLVEFDRDRALHPISASAVRADPAAHWEQLDGPVRAYLAKRVAVVGAESTGTTTLTRALAEHYGTTWAPEYGRQVSEDKLAAGTFKDPWTASEFIEIAARQQADEDDAAARGGPVMFCDTDALATCIWEERYLGASGRVTESIAARRTPALYLMTDEAGVPFEAQAVRDGQHVRAWMSMRFRERLAAQPAPWIELHGDHGTRMRTAVAAVDALVGEGWRFAPSLGELGAAARGRDGRDG